MTRVRSWMRLVVAVVVLWALACVPAFATGSVVVTVTNYNTVTKYVIAWTSDASGNVNTNPIAVSLGYLQQLKIVPGTGGTQPTNAYGVKLVDQDGLDVLNATGLAQSNATPLLITFNPGIYTDAVETFDLQVTGAGNAKTGVVTLWVR
jgi:hypothetical protein